MYDPAATQQLLKIVAAYASHPLGEYLSKLGTQLFDADKEINDMLRSRVDRQGEIDVANTRFRTEEKAHGATKMKLSEEIRILTDQNAALVAGLEKIRLDSRGAKAIAAETLKKVEAMVPSATPV